MTHAAITDHGVMYGCIDFYKECLAQGIKPILGCEVYVSPASRFDKNPSENRYYHLILLAENDQGLDNLDRIVSAGFLEGFYYRPRIDWEILEKYHEGLICLSACLAGEVPRHIAMGDYEGAKQVALRYRELFGEDHYYLEIQDHGIPEERHTAQMLIRMSEETGIPLVCTNDCHYTREEDAEAHDILLCIQTQKKVQDEDRMRYEGGQYFVKSEEEMRRLFGHVPEALENTQKIAERCQVNIVFGDRKIPQYDCPNGLTSREYLNQLCEEGLQRNYKNAITPQIRERMEYELNVIDSMGFVDYFLIVWDYVHYAKTHGVPVGPGRGSAAGSLVSYCLDITTLDPLKYDLIFERFLNPERVTMPDVDMDFGYEERQQVIDYVVEKYGRERVVQIITFGTLQPRGVIRDVGRALDLPYSECDKIAKMIPKELKITLNKALNMNPELRTLYETNEQIRYLIDICRKLEGLPRNTSMHAAGVVISKLPVVDYVPLSKAQDGSVTTEYTMTTLEELGLLKMDFLGLRTLNVVRDAADLVRARGIDLSIDDIDYDDRKVMDMIGRGKTEGVFQIESAGMKSFMKELKPNSLEDIIAGIALYRPGPMDFIPRYIKGKNAPESIRYDCPQMEPILKSTYGCIVYQEQVMQIVRDLAGYSMGRSDLVRRAMSKKKASVMEEERRNFIHGNAEQGVRGCVANGISEEVANHIYDEMVDFAKYAFNKSHAAAYAVITMQTAYLKCYYPVEFMAALLTSVIDNPIKCAEYLVHCREMGIQILPPSLNHSFGHFTTENGNIRYGLYAIKGVGRGVVDQIVSEREANGIYDGMQEFFERNANADLNKRFAENMIKAGAFDDFAGNRKQFMGVYQQVMDQISSDKKDSIQGQMSIFDLMAPEEKKHFEIQLPKVGEYNKETILAYEKEVLGVYLSGHPLEDYDALWKSQITALSSDFALDEESGESKVCGDSRVTIGGMITAKTIKYTKNNKVMAFLTVEDLVGVVEVVVFPNVYEKYKALMEEEGKIFVKGRVSQEDDRASKLICEDIYGFDQVSQEVWIAFSDAEDYRRQKELLFSVARENQGSHSVCIFLRNTKQYQRLPASMQISASPDTFSVLKAAFGEKNVTTRIISAK